MINATVNNELNLTYPDSFRAMSEEELTRYFSSPQNRWGVYDADRHIILSVSWTKAGSLFNRKPRAPEDLLTHSEARMSRNLLYYQKLGSFQTKIAGKKSEGIRFMYRVNSAKAVQIADLFVFKYKKNLYAIHYITRKATAADDRLILQEVLKTASVR